MQLTRAADYGVRVLMHLAERPAGTHLRREELARAAGVPDTFMSKVLQRLVASRLLVSRRGRRGGFGLARPGAAISLLDVVTAMEGPLCLNLCLGPGEPCDRRAWCAAHVVWAQAQASLTELLAAASIDQLARLSAMRRAIITPR